ncbi:PEP-CTERM sorting domain-containing protein [Cerasicoccus maritimus]|uniref:PEP-CTERM sorting domain-containing protein n=1 Tax=Cerasicoccus maritimus TaxID=490089 RepID=UPI0028527E24|nr:PEP-CTERM sorting domain-containing protein [Cerasicoccus maritimus]
MKQLSLTLTLASTLYVSLTSVSATILAYEGFSTDATGSSANYADGVILQGIDKARTGFTGAWAQTAGTLTTEYNVESVTGNLTYDGYIAGDEGRASAYLTTGSSSSAGALGRTTSIDSSQITTSLYLALLIDFNDAEGGFSWTSDFGSNNYLFLNNTTLTFSPAGGSATGGFSTDIGTLGVSASGVNLFVLEYTTDTTGVSNPNYYSHWNLYINPDLTDGALSSDEIDATGIGIGLLNGGTIVAPSEISIANRYINAGENMYADEIYLTNDPADFIAVPEPSTYAAILGFATLGLCLLRRRA